MHLVIFRQNNDNAQQVLSFDYRSTETFVFTKKVCLKGDAQLKGECMQK